MGPFLGILARSPPGAEGKPPEQGSQAAGDVAPSGRVGGHLVCRQAPVCSLGSLGTRAGPGPPPRLPRGGHEDGPLSSVPPRPWMAFGLTAGRACSAKSWPFGSSSECQHFEPGRPLALLCSFLGSEVVRPRGRADAGQTPTCGRDLCALRGAFQQCQDPGGRESPLSHVPSRDTRHHTASGCPAWGRVLR